MKWKKSELVILGILGAAGIAAVVALGSILLEYTRGSAIYSELESYVFLPDAQGTVPTPDGQEGRNPQTEAEGGLNNSSSTENTPTGETGETGSVQDNYMAVSNGQGPQVDFAGLQTKNSDVVGWIYGPDTVINYPVVQGQDNDFYLTHAFDGSRNNCGSIFMDSLNEADFSSTNTILQGHHMKNGSMFASLTKYLNQSYYDAHPMFWLVTPEKSYQVEVFTGFVTRADSDVWQIAFATKEEYQNWLDKMVGNGAFESNVKPGTDDQILTLSTCSYEYDDARFVVMGILREQ